VAARQARARVAPGLAEVLAAPHRRAIPLAAAAGQDRARPRLDREVVERPALAQRTADVPAPATRVAVEDEGALAGADEEHDSLGHLPSPVSFVPGQPTPSGIVARWSLDTSSPAPS